MEFALTRCDGFCDATPMKMKEKLGSEMVEDFAHYAEREHHLQTKITKEIIWLN